MGRITIADMTMVRIRATQVAFPIVDGPNLGELLAKSTDGSPPFRDWR